MSYITQKTASAEITILEISGHWQSVLPVREDSAQMPLQIYNDYIPKAN